VTAVAERFARDTAGHRMIVLRDDGLYRHIRFQHHILTNDAEVRPGRSSYWFDLVTWPGCLTINGDCGTFTFSRTTDMFEFFRGDYVNPQYWAEKVRAADRGGVTVYSPEKFRQEVAGYVKEAEEDWPGLTEAVEREFFGVMAEWNTGTEHDAGVALNSFTYQPDGDTGEPFRFLDAWEWDLTDYAWQYLWCCHAIQWGIARYEAARAVTP
jgi:hypothetical protein